MYEKVKEYVRKHHMLTEKDRVVTGVSGGADSICLLFILLGLSEEMGFTIHAVHIHHGIRGADADADETFVRRICREKDVPLTVYREDVPAYAAGHGISEEEAGREVRRSAFEKTLRIQKGTKIALAHHMNDNAETVLWNLCRGTGLRGLGGIVPVSGVWIRPLLCVKRTEIESYLGKWGISYCTDQTNMQNIYTRNRIRNEILTSLEGKVNTQAVLHIAETAERMQALEGYIRREVSCFFLMCTREEAGGMLLLEKEYLKADEALRPYVLHEALCAAAGHRKDMGAVHVRLTAGLLGKQTGRRLSLPYGLTAVRCYEGIRFVRQENVPRGEEKPPFRFRIIEKSERMETIPKKTYTKWFDYDIIKNTVQIRHREPGDYLTIDKYGNTQKLKQFFVNQKIPQENRSRIWLAADGSHIMWVIGYRQSQKYQVTEKTRRILEIEVYGGERDGGDDQHHAQRGRGCKEN